MAAGDAAMRDAIRAGEYPGPQLLCCGPFVDGEPPLWPGSQVVTDASTASQAVTRIHAEGYDCVKVYNELTEVAAAAIHRTARELGIPVIGHVPWRTDFTAAHIDDVQHLVGLYHANPQIEADPGVHAMLQLASVDRERVDDIIAALPSTPKALTPTLITLQRKYALKDSTQLANSAQAQLLPNYYSSHLWHPSQGLVSARVLTTQDQHEFSALYPAVERSLMQLYLAGLPLHTGTDAPAEFIVPGAGLWEELQLLSAIGLGPETALKLSTVDTARYLRGGGEDRPQLSEGAPADFVVYSKDPTSDLRHLSSRTAVVTQGRVYTGEMLDQQLQRYQSWYENPAYRLTSNTLVKSGLALIGALQ
jgi:imidazolonepropionase-like amidohydrolase